ncbi:hypothetical protein AAVH_08934 [Aphelenchoides avenae]|nr:hypothetical protein AAVH_08934 [Aphelenchus avenae]
MDPHHLCNSSGPFNAQSLLRDARELQQLCESGQKLSEKCNLMMLECQQMQSECQRMQSDYDGMQKRAVGLAGKLTQHAIAAQQLASSYENGQPSLASFAYENLAADPSYDMWQQGFGPSLSGLFNADANRDFDIRPSGSGATIKAEIGDQSCKSEEPEHRQVTERKLVINDGPRKRPSTAASSSSAKKPRDNNNKKAIILDELREHLANFPNLRDEATGDFKCPVCDGVVKSKPVRHLQEHLDKAYHPYKCSEEGCDITAVRLDTVQKHVVNVHKLQWTDEQKAACTDAEKELLMKARN